MAGEGEIIAIDPGREKSGLALLAPGRVIDRRVIRTSDLVRTVEEILNRHPSATLVVGNRTSSSRARHELERRFPALAVAAVEERGTTLEARRLYFEDHPPTGWRRLLPLSLQLPPEPYDDYAAVVLGRRFLASGRSIPELP